MPEIGETYKSKSWDQIINDMAVRVLGHDAASKIPVFIAPDYEAIMGYATINEQQQLVFQVKCLGVNATSATRLYNEKMEENGFYLSSEGNYGYQMYDYYSDFFLGYSLDTEGDIPSFTIQARLQKTREEQWDTTSVNLYSDMEVPACPAPAYQTSYDSSSGTLTVFALFVDRNTIVSEYVNILTKNGFTYVSTDNYGFVTLVDNSGYLTVMLYLTYGEYDSDALYIKFTNIWPSIPILAYIGCAMFPKLESLTASYDGYSYVQYGDGEDDYALCIYFKDASSNDYYNYLNAIEAYDFNRGETSTSSTDIVDTTFLAYTMDGYTLKVRVMYQIPSNVVCVAIYQAYQELF